MRSTAHPVSVLTLFLWSATNTAANSLLGDIVSAARKFTGGPAPVVELDYGKFRGVGDDITGTYNYLGIPYAHAPRFDLSTPITHPLAGIQDVSDYGPACPQHEVTSTLSPADLGLGALAGSILGLLSRPVLRESEDCLNINVQVPKNIPEGAKLPVVHWIHGGAFETGSNAAWLSPLNAVPGISYQGAEIVKRSVDIGLPVIYVSSNYRLNSFGFSASEELAKEGLLNLGLKDQRLAMKWVKKHISKFGGDPDQITLWGESAGAWSISTHLVANDGDNEDLFRGVIAQSGGPIKVQGPERQQPIFDRMVSTAGCSAASDKIACLRDASYQSIYSSVQAEPYFVGYHSLQSTWAPRPDGTFLTKSPHILVEEGKIANVSLIIGDMKDEGTLFSLINSLNTTTTDQFKDYFNSIWWPMATSDEMDRLAELYPQDPTAGSPFDTGILNSITPQYKRISALTGDYSFESQRRQLLSNAPGSKWTYQTDNSLANLPLSPPLLGDNILNIPVLGSFHGSDIFFYDYGTLPVPNSKNIMDTTISFVSTLDPNNHGRSGLTKWPEYTSSAKNMYHFIESGPEVITDTYREDQMAYINSHADAFLI
ncbi:Alpha/Beta hydrolase protein [Aspergillus crustosus]